MMIMMIIMVIISFKERERLNILSLPNTYSNEEEFVISVIFKPVFNI